MKLETDFGAYNLPSAVIQSLSCPETLLYYKKNGIQSYHYIIDGQYHLQNNPMIFDEDRYVHDELEHIGQPGYLEAMLNGLHFVQAHIKSPLTLEFILRLYSIITQDVHFERFIGFGGWGSGTKESFSPQLRNKQSTVLGFGFNISNLTATEEGLNEIKTHFSHLASVYDPQFDDEYKITPRIYIKIENECDINNTINELISSYYQSARTNVDIANFAHQMNLLHPFEDGNIRLIVFLLVNKMLIDEDRPPIVFHNPNIFDGFSVRELGLFLDEEIKRSGQLCQDLNDPFRLSNLERSCLSSLNKKN